MQAEIGIALFKRKGLRCGSACMQAGTAILRSIPRPFCFATRALSEFAARAGLGQSDAADYHFGDVIVLSMHDAAGHAAQHGELTGVRQGIGYGSLKKLLGQFV